MTDESKRGMAGDSAHPKAGTPKPDHSGEFSAQPKGPVIIKKSLQPLSGAPMRDPSGVGASTQPKAPLTTSQAKPPPSGDD